MALSGLFQVAKFVRSTPVQTSSCSAIASASRRRPRSVCLPDSAAFVASPFQAFVGDFRPEFFQLPRGSPMCVPFGVI
jgi:hypothetical protein